MARKFLISVDLNKNELQNARVQNLGSAPSSPVSGQIYFDTGDNTMYFYNGTSWIPTSGSAEVIQDTVSTMILDGTGLDKSYDDPAGTLTLSIDSTVTTNSGTQTLTNKTIDLTNNTLQGTIAEFNTALEDADFATIAGAETLTNKTLTSPSVSGLYISDSAIVFEGSPDDFETTLAITSPTADRQITLPNATGTAALLENKLHDFALATADVNLNSNKITNLAEPVNATDAATKGYVDAVAQGLHVHEAAHAATTASLATLTSGTVTYDNGTAGVGATLTLEYALTVLDGHTLNTGDRILVKNESTAAHNGIYVYTSSTVLTRADDFNSAVEIHGGDFVFVENGSLYNSTGWVNENEVTTVGTDGILFLQFSGAGTYTASHGIYLDGTIFKADVTPATGNPSLINTNSAIEVKTDTTRGLSVDANGLGIYAGTGFTYAGGALSFASGYGVRKYTANVGNNSLTQIDVTHSFGTRDVTVHIYENASAYAQVEADVEHYDSNTVRLKFAVAPTTDQYRVVIVG